MDVSAEVELELPVFCGHYDECDCWPERALYSVQVKGSVEFTSEVDRLDVHVDRVEGLPQPLAFEDLSESHLEQCALALQGVFETRVVELERFPALVAHVASTHLPHAEKVLTMGREVFELGAAEQVGALRQQLAQLVEAMRSLQTEARRTTKPAAKPQPAAKKEAA